MNADRIRVWIARFAAPLAFFFAATVLVILVQRALESDSGEAGATSGSTTERSTPAPTTTTPDGTTTASRAAAGRPATRVKSGDTLESIAAKCDVPLADAARAQPQRSTRSR